MLTQELSPTEEERVDKNLQEVMACTCLRIRRTSRLITQVYEHAIEGTGLTINQFGLLANLYGVDLVRSAGLPIGTLSERLGADPTTLNRMLKPLVAKGLVRDLTDPADARVRIVRITEKGKREFLKAIPLWRQAQERVDGMLGTKTMAALNDLLDRCGNALARGV
jgi:DNA-binding MarR family transcriptional regulator